MSHILPVLWQSRGHNRVDPWNFVLRDIDRYLAEQVVIAAERYGKRYVEEYLLVHESSQWSQKMLYTNNRFSNVDNKDKDNWTHNVLFAACEIRESSRILIQYKYQGPIETAFILEFFILTNDKEDYIVQSRFVLVTRRRIQNVDRHVSS